MDRKKVQQGFKRHKYKERNPQGGPVHINVFKICYKKEI